MRKILNNGFKSFWCSKSFHYELNISCTFSRDKIFQIWHDWHGKRLKKDVEKSNIESLNQWIMGWFFNLIPFIYICTIETYSIGHRSCAENQEQHCKILPKNLETVFISRARFKAPNAFQHIAKGSRKLLQSKPSLQTSRSGRTTSHFS